MTIQLKPLILSLITMLRLPHLAMRSRALVKKYFDYKYRQEDPYGVMRNPLDTRYNDMLALINNRCFKKGLDIGCGDGVFTKMLLELCKSVDGIDISKSAIDRARVKHASCGALKFFVSDFPHDAIHEKYDLVVCAEVLYYLSHKQLIKAVEVISQLLASEGFLLVGNIKKIKGKNGFFRNRLGANEINRLLKNSVHFRLVEECDRGNDMLALLLRKRL